MCFIASAWNASDDIRRSLVGSSVRESAIVLRAADQARSLQAESALRLEKKH